ncbi:hypothetical protein F2P81_002821 [Scophthalmus maximus]|uniref:Uncharacterized protein n=1 Tax=Scophthalmus maximus TaxID=52904 RepID=A0A6A4TW74_SCOMX|nr:hypothetical protein F2P81_002821 [Scophthalmus maximus]
MERGTPQRKTVYRISLTLVKRESLDDEEQDPPRADNPKVGPFQRGGSVEVQRGAGLLEQLKEAEDEAEDLSSSRGYMRNFRTFSTGQLELGRLKMSRKHLFQKELKATSPLAEREAPEVVSPQRESGRQEAADSDALTEDICSESRHTDAAVENGSVSKRKRLLKAKSMEERSCEPPLNSEGKMSHSTSNGKAAKVPSPETPPAKRPPGLLRRSFSFRHWTGGELLRLRALSKDKHHSSSGCIARDTGPDGGEVTSEAAVVAPPSRHKDLTRQKSRTLEVGAVLNKTDSMSELSRWERARGGKNRTLDNSDLLRLAAENDGAGGGFLLRGVGGRSSERRLVRFFSGIFSRRDGASTSTPVGSPSTNRSLRRSMRAALSQSSTESMNGGSADGKNMMMRGPLTCVCVCDQAAAAGEAGSVCVFVLGSRVMFCCVSDDQTLLFVFHYPENEKLNLLFLVSVFFVFLNNIPMDESEVGFLQILDEKLLNGRGDKDEDVDDRDEWQMLVYLDSLVLRRYLLPLTQ